VCQLFQNPQRLEREYHRRGPARPRGARWETTESLRAQSTKLQREMARLIEDYAGGLIENAEFEPRVKRIKQRVSILAEQLQQLADEAAQQREPRLLLGQLEEFVTKVQRNLATAAWEMKRELIRALVQQVESDLRLSRSLDGGLSFNSHLRINEDRPISHSFEDLAVTADGTVVLS
jgi:site-specific DNA recombinase